jgi:hypothetical protein
MPEMMMGRHAAGLLAKQGIIPVVVSPNPRDPTQSVRCPGPMLDSNRYPYKVGTRFPASTIYSRYRLKKGKVQRAWNQDIWAANACVFLFLRNSWWMFRLFPASRHWESVKGLETNLVLVLSFMALGGVPVVNGFVSPSANSNCYGCNGW